MARYLVMGLSLWEAANPVAASGCVASRGAQAGADSLPACRYVQLGAHVNVLQKWASAEGKLFILCREKCLEGQNLQGLPYLRCSFLVLFQALRITQRLFYGPSSLVTVAVEVQYLPPPPQWAVVGPTIMALAQGPCGQRHLLFWPHCQSGLYLGAQSSGGVPGASADPQ